MCNMEVCNSCDKNTAVNPSTMDDVLVKNKKTTDLDHIDEEYSNNDYAAAAARDRDDGGELSAGIRQRSIGSNNNEDKAGNDGVVCADNDDEGPSSRPKIAHSSSTQQLSLDESGVSELGSASSSPENVFIARDIKKSMSFGGYGLLPGQKGREEVSFAELKLLVEEGKREPTKTTKQKIKEFADKYKDFKVAGARRLPWYKEVLQQSQLAHLITLMAVVSLAFRLCPDARRSPAESSTLTRLVYIATVSTVFGTEFWMTFVSGLALFFSVSRHVFAQVQVVLFPLYFLLKAVLLLLALFAYTHYRPTHTWNTSQFIQGTLLAVGFMVNLAIRLYFSPALITLITIKMAIEREEGMGSEVGSSAPGRLVHCPHYMKLHRAFRRVHAITAVGNILGMATTSLHLYNLAIELCSVV